MTRKNIKLQLTTIDTVAELHWLPSCTGMPMKLTCAALLLCLATCSAFSQRAQRVCRASTSSSRSLAACDDEGRRAALAGALLLAPAALLRPLAPAQAAASAAPPLVEALPALRRARAQLDAVPAILEAKKWDSVRAILATPPLSDCWAKNAPFLKRLAAAIGDELPDGDEMAALEAGEDAISHLRYLDMAVYNNVFNPIGTEGTNGVSKDLVRSYYEDPARELKASIAALDEIISLGTR